MSGDTDLLGPHCMGSLVSSGDDACTCLTPAEERRLAAIRQAVEGLRRREGAAAEFMATRKGRADEQVLLK